MIDNVSMAVNRFKMLGQEVYLDIQNIFNIFKSYDTSIKECSGMSRLEVFQKMELSVIFLLKRRSLN